MPSRKQPISTFNHQQRRLLWTMLGATVVAAGLLLALSWRLSRLDVWPATRTLSVLPALFQGEALSEQSVASLPTDSGLDELSLLASPDGLGLAYILKNERSEQLVLNEQAGPIVDDITFMSFSPDGQRFAYTVKQNQKERAIIDGKSGREYDWIFNPRFFSPDSRYFIYKARNGSKDVLVMNETESRPYDRIYEPFLSPDKSALIFFARDGDRLWRGQIPLAAGLE